MIDEIFLRRFPADPGFQARDTSRAAAVAMAPRAPRIRELVLAEIEATPSTVHEVATRLRRPVSTVQPRFSELEGQGKIEDSGFRRHNAASGKKAIVWKAKGTP